MEDREQCRPSLSRSGDAETRGWVDVAAERSTPLAALDCAPKVALPFAQPAGQP